MKRLLPLMCLTLAAGCDQGTPTTGTARAPTAKVAADRGTPVRHGGPARTPASTTINAVRFSPDGRRAFFSYWNDDYSTAPDFVRVRAYNVETGAEVWSSTDRDAFPKAFTADGRLMFGFDYSSPDGKATMRRADSGKVVRTFLDPEMPVGNLHATPDGKRLLTEDKIGRLLLWDADSGKLLRTFGGDGGSLHLFHDGTRVLTASGSLLDGRGKVWELATGQAVQAFDLPACYRLAPAITPDDKYILLETSGEEAARVPRTTKYRLALWDLVAGKIIRTFAERVGGTPPSSCWGSANQCVFLDGGKQLLTSDDDNVLRLWDVHSGELLKSWEHRQYDALSSDGKLGVTHLGELYDVNTGNKLRYFAYREPTQNPFHRR